MYKIEEVKTIQRHCFVHLFANTCENLDKMDDLLGKYYLSKLTPQEVEILTRPLTMEETEKVIKELLQPKRNLTAIKF